MSSEDFEHNLNKIVWFDFKLLSCGKTPMHFCWIWCFPMCQYMHSVAIFIVRCKLVASWLQVGYRWLVTTCMQYSCDEVFVRQIFIMLLGLNLQHSLQHSYISYCIRDLPVEIISNKSQEMDHARLWGDNKLQPKQPNSCWIKPRL